MGALVGELPCRVIFCGFGALTNTKALMNRRKMLNPPKITRHGNSHSATPKKDYKRSQGVVLKIMGRAIFYYKIYFIKKCLVLALYEVEVQLHV